MSDASKLLEGIIGSQDDPAPAATAENPGLKDVINPIIEKSEGTRRKKNSEEHIKKNYPGASTIDDEGSPIEKDPAGESLEGEKPKEDPAPAPDGQGEEGEKSITDFINLRHQKKAAKQEEQQAEAKRFEDLESANEENARLKAQLEAQTKEFESVSQGYASHHNNETSEIKKLEAAAGVALNKSLTKGLPRGIATDDGKILPVSPNLPAVIPILDAWKQAEASGDQQTQQSVVMNFAEANGIPQERLREDPRLLTQVYNTMVEMTEEADEHVAGIEKARADVGDLVEKSYSSRKDAWKPRLDAPFAQEGVKHQDGSVEALLSAAMKEHKPLRQFLEQEQELDLEALSIFDPEIARMPVKDSSRAGMIQHQKKLAAHHERVSNLLQRSQEAVIMGPMLLQAMQKAEGLQRQLNELKGVTVPPAGASGGGSNSGGKVEAPAVKTHEAFDQGRSTRRARRKNS